MRHPLVTMAPASQHQNALTVAEWPVGNVLMATASVVSVSYHTSSVAAWTNRATVVVNIGERAVCVRVCVCVYVCVFMCV